MTYYHCAIGSIPFASIYIFFLVFDHGVRSSDLKFVIKYQMQSVGDTDLLSWQKTQKYLVLECCVMLWLANEA